MPHEGLDTTKVWPTHPIQTWFWHKHETVYSNCIAYQILQRQGVKKKRILSHVLCHNAPVLCSWQLRGSVLVNHPEILMRKTPDLVTINMTLDWTGRLYLKAADHVADMNGVAADCNQVAISYRSKGGQSYRMWQYSDMYWRIRSNIRNKQAKNYTVSVIKCHLS